MKQQNFLLLTLCLSSVYVLHGQNPDADRLIIQAQPDSSSNSASTLSLGLVFDSRALVAGRDFDLAQQAFVPSLFYSHTSGLYAAASGSFLSAADPVYTQTTLGVGYARRIGEYVYTSLAYDHFFFHPADEGLLQNSLTAYASLGKGIFNLGASYTALFDPETAHQVNMSTSVSVQKTLDQIQTHVFFTPNISLMAGTETVPLQRFSNQLIKKGTGRSWEERVRQPRPGTKPQNEAEQTIFGPLSLTFSLPVNIQTGNVDISFTANYVVPFATASETVKPDNSLYFSAGLNWTLKQ